MVAYPHFQLLSFFAVMEFDLENVDCRRNPPSFHQLFSIEFAAVSSPDTHSLLKTHMEQKNDS